MNCKKCGSEDRTQYGSEINVHFQGSSDPDKQAVLLFPTLWVCLKCGFAEFTLSEAEIGLLSKRVEQ